MKRRGFLRGLLGAAVAAPVVTEHYQGHNEWGIIPGNSDVMQVNGTEGVEVMRISSNGHVGINTSAPSQKLQVS